MTYQLKQLIINEVENCKDVDLLDLLYKIIAASANSSEGNDGELETDRRI